VPSQPIDPLVPCTGSFRDVSLEFVPDGPPLSNGERSDLFPNYPTELAFLHVFLDGKNVTGSVPSAYMLLLLDHLLSSLGDLVQGNPAVAMWFADPWQFDLVGDPAQDRVIVTLHVPGRWEAMKDVLVPLSRFGRSVIRVADGWREYLIKNYPVEISDHTKDAQYKRFTEHLTRARQILLEYEAQL
jgi:hypothetical protein